MKISPISLGIMVVLVASALAYNLLVLQKYNALMAHLQQNHPNLYERLRMKPDVGGVLYSTKNHAKPLLDFAKRHPPLNDPIAEKLLAEYANFYQKGTIVIAIAFGIGAIILLMDGISQ